MTKTPHDDDNTTPSIVSAPQALTSIFSASVVLLSTLTVLPLPSYSAPVTTVAQRIAASQAAPATTAGQKIATTQAVQPKSAVEVATKTLEDSKTIFANAKNNAEKASFESKQRNADVKLDKAAVDKDKIEFMKANDDLAKDRAQRDNDSAIATYTKKYGT